MINVNAYAGTPLSGLPSKNPLSGTKIMYCVELKWTNQDMVNEAQCMNMMKFVSDFYKANSRGLLVIEPHFGVVSTGVDATESNITLGNDLATKTFKADYYLLPNRFNGGDHSGDKIAYLSQILNTVATHETGHLIGIQHTTGLPPEPKLDTGSIMNPDARPSNYLTAPQYYYKDWLKPAEVALYDGSANGTYLLKHPLDPKAPGYSTVILPPSVMTAGDVERYIFLSYPPRCQTVPGNKCVDMHIIDRPQGEQGGSQKIKEIAAGNSYSDTAFSGVTVQVNDVPNSDNLQIVLNVNGAILKGIHGASSSLKISNRIPSNR